MQQIYLESFIVGYARKMINTQDIARHPSKHIIEHRVKVICFYDDYGAIATKRAFAVSRSTVFAWKKRLRDQSGHLSALAPASTAPKQRRRRSVDYRISDFIVQQRTQHPRLSKDKLAVLLVPQCQTWGIATPSASTVGRMLHDLRQQGRLPQYQRLRLQGGTGRLHQHRYRSHIKKHRRGAYTPQQAGDLVQVDCVVKFVAGLRRYVISAVDYQSEFAFSMAYASLSSAKAANFLRLLTAVAPFPIQRVQTDNGSEFHKLFHQACDQMNIIHYWNYPRRPKMNAKIERFNRTIQEEFVDARLDDIAHNLPYFNEQLMDWLVWYNSERPHWTLQLKSPMQALLDTLQLPRQESSMWWTDTSPSIICRCPLSLGKVKSARNSKEAIS